MMQVVPQTHEEKIKMYMKLSKKQIIEMLIQCNNILEYHSKNSQPSYIVACDHNWLQDFSGTSTHIRCTKCGEIQYNNTLTFGDTTAKVTEVSRT